MARSKKQTCASAPAKWIASTPRVSLPPLTRVFVTQALMLDHPKKDTRDLALYAPFCRNGKAPDPRDLNKPTEEWSGRGRPKGLKALSAEVRPAL